MKLQLAVTALLGSIATVSAGGGFALSCSDYWYDNGWLKAYCGDGAGGWPYTELDLNTAFGNSWGQISVRISSPKNSSLAFKAFRLMRFAVAA